MSKPTRKYVNMGYYNPELKERFIEEKESSINSRPYENYFKNIFKRVALKEEELEKDLYDFTAYDLLEYYKELNMRNIDSLYNIHNLFYQYYRFCMDHNYTNNYNNPYVEIKKGVLRKCVNIVAVKNRLVTREEIFELCQSPLIDKAFEKFILLALFEGIKGEKFIELIQLKIKDFDKYYVNLSTGRTIPISKQLYSYAFECDEEKEYTTKNGKRRVYNDGGVGYIYKTSMKTDFFSDIEKRRISLQKMLGLLFTKLSGEKVLEGRRLKALDIYFSGAINYIRNICEKNELTFIDFTRNTECMSDLENRYPDAHYKILNTRKDFITKYGIDF